MKLVTTVHNMATSYMYHQTNTFSVKMYLDGSISKVFAVSLSPPSTKMMAGNTSSNGLPCTKIIPINIK